MLSSSRADTDTDSVLAVGIQMFKISVSALAVPRVTDLAWGI